MILWIYLIIINFTAFIIWCLDKHYAIVKHRRISEKALFTLALLGGSFGSLCAMQLVRHKTRHRYFKIGIPLLLLLQIFVICYISKNIL